MNIILATLSFLISGFFIYNFNTIVAKIRKGKLVNKLSLLATSSLILHFLSLSLFFIYNNTLLILFSELYMLGCLIYLLRKK